MTIRDEVIRLGPVNVLAKFEVRSFTRSRDNREYPKNLDSPCIRPRSILSKIFLTGFYSEWPCKYIPQIWSPYLPIPEIRGVAKVANPNLEEGEAIGGRDDTIRKSVGQFLLALQSINTLLPEI